MKDILKNKKNKYIFILVVVFLVISFIIYGRFASADTAANKVAIRSVKMTKITTGTSTFDSSDGLNYSDTNSYSVMNCGSIKQSVYIMRNKTANRMEIS